MIITKIDGFNKLYELTILAKVDTVKIDLERLIANLGEKLLQFHFEIIVIE